MQLYFKSEIYLSSSHTNVRHIYIVIWCKWRADSGTFVSDIVDIMFKTAQEWGWMKGLQVL